MCTFHLTFKTRCATKTVPLLSQRLQYCQKEEWLFTIHSVRILEQFKGSCTGNYWEIGRNHHFHLHQKGFWAKLALMQKSSILLRIGHWRLCFHPLAYFLQQRSCEMTRHAKWPQHLWVSLENAAPDKWVCGDERLMEWLAKVMMLWESPFCSLISIWNNTTVCKWLITSAKGQPGGTKIHHLVQTLSFLLARVEMLVGSTCWFK